MAAPWGAALAAAAIVLLAACTVLPVGRWVTMPLEDRFPPPGGYPARVDGVVVLGGGVDGDITKARGQPSFGETMERFAAIPELARRYPGRTPAVHRRNAWMAAAMPTPRPR